MLKRFGLLFFSFVLVLAVNGQDPHFSQYYANPLYLNPAMAGSNVGPRVVMNYRNQWPSIPGTFQTYSASYDQYFDKLSGGVGVLLTADRSGESIFKHDAASLMYSNNLNLSRTWAIKTGLQASFVQKSLNWNNLVFPDQLDARRGLIRSTSESLPSGGITDASYMDFSAGVVLYNENFWVGGAAHHLTEPNESLLNGSGGDAPLPMKLTFHMGGNIVVEEARFGNSGTYLSPNIIYQQQGPFNTINGGFYVIKGPITGGLWYRYSGAGSDIGGTSDAFVVLAGIRQGVFSFGYSYDITVSDLRDAATGSHEVSISLLFDEKKKIRKKDVQPLKCPAF